MQEERREFLLKNIRQDPVAYPEQKIGTLSYIFQDERAATFL